MTSVKKMIKTAGFMIIATFAAKICGMLRDSFIAAYFATGPEADAFFAATKIPLLFFDLVIGGVISAAFIPVFNEYLEKDGKARAIEFANRFINVVLILTGVVCALGILFSSQLIDFIMLDRAESTKQLAIHLSNIMFPMIIFTGLAFSFVGILQSFGEFNIPAIISLVSNGVMILYLLIFKDRFGVTGVAVAMLVGWGAQALIQIPSLVKFQFRYRFDFHFRDDGLKKTLFLAIPLLISTWVQPFGTLINMRFSSSLGEGIMSALEYANRLYTIIVGVFSFVVTNLIYPLLSRANAAGNKEEHTALMRGALKSVSLVILPIMAGLMILAKPAVALVFQHGEFDASSTALTSTALMFYSVGMLGYSYAEVLNKSFFAMQNSKTPMITAIISIVVNVILSYLLSQTMGIGGLALASALASTLNAALNFIFMSRKAGGILTKSDFGDICKIVLSVLVMSAVVFCIYQYTAAIFPDNIWGRILLLLVGAGSGVAVYVPMCAVLRVNEIKLLFRMFQPKKRGE